MYREYNKLGDIMKKKNKDNKKSKFRNFKVDFDIDLNKKYDLNKEIKLTKNKKKKK